MNYLELSRIILSCWTYLLDLLREWEAQLYCSLALHLNWRGGLLFYSGIPVITKEREARCYLHIDSTHIIITIKGVGILFGSDCRLSSKTKSRQHKGMVIGKDCISNQHGHIVPKVTNAKLNGTLWTCIVLECSSIVVKKSLYPAANAWSTSFLFGES